MKKIICIAICWPLLQVYKPVFGQKNESNNKSQEIIIMKNGDKDEKVTIETKNGETLINGKPASEYKDGNIRVITGKEGNNFVFTPRSGMNLFTNGEKRAFLGVTTEKDDKGVKVTNVEKGSAAEKSGLKEGDIITMVGSKKISDPDDLSDAVTSYKPKDEIKISYDRNGKSESAKATLGERQDMVSAFSYNAPNMKMNQELLRNYNRNFNDRNFSFTMPPMNFSQNQPFNVLRMGNRRLGVRIEDADNNEGAKVTSVQEGSVAEKAGLKKDDIITEVNGKKVKDVNEVLSKVRETTDKESYTIRAKRNGSEMNFDIKIPKRKNNADL